MPPYKKFASRAQQAWAHTATGMKALGASDVAGKDRASKGKAMPAHAVHMKPARAARGK